MTTTLRPVTSLMMLERLAGSDGAYRKLAMAAAVNLGGSASSLPEAMKWLRINAMETSEQEVIDEVNFCR